MIASPEPEEQELHVSPDGQLALCISPNVEGETMIGFHGFDWAMAASQLPDSLGQTALQIAQDYANLIINDDALIAVLRVDGEMVDVWVTEFPHEDLNCAEAHEQVSFRRWSGVAVRIDELPGD